MKQLPNFFTLLNLFCGCIAIVFIMQTDGGVVVLDAGGATELVFPERMALGSVFIFIAAAVDFFDGFFARLLKASTDRGKQLDSLSDVVSFGAAPGMILYQLLRLGFADSSNGIDTSFYYLLPAFIFTGAVAWRLAKFNVSTVQTTSFIGVPSPAAGLVVASFPLIIWYESLGIQRVFINIGLLYSVIAALAFLMVCNRRFIALKFKNFSFSENKMAYGLIGLSVVAVIFLGWLAVPAIFVLYLIFSFLSKAPATSLTDSNKTLDLTV